MRKLFLVSGLLCTMVLPSPVLRAAEAVPAAERSIQERLDDLEAYVNNGSRNANTNTTSKIAGPGPGHNAWMMTSSALVLFMTLPGLALFYGGLVRKKNVLSVLAQCLGITGLVTILWYLVGYSLTFHSGETARGWSFMGTLDWSFLKGVDSTPNADYGGWVSHNVYAMYQMMFAIITPALIVGAIAERMKFSAILLFMTLWMLIVYFPLAHMVWGIDGMMSGVGNAKAPIHAIDFAAYVFGMVGLNPLLDSGQTTGIRQRGDAAAQHGALHGRHRHVVGRMVWIQRRQRRGRRRHRR